MKNTTAFALAALTLVTGTQLPRLFPAATAVAEAPTVVPVAKTVPAVAAQELPTEPDAIDFSANTSTADEHGPLIAQDGSELAPFGSNTCANFYQWSIESADWNRNGAIDMEDEIKLCRSAG